jgi:hypothetical protein
MKSASNLTFTLISQNMQGTFISYKKNEGKSMEGVRNAPQFIHLISGSSLVRTVDKVQV